MGVQQIESVTDSKVEESEKWLNLVLDECVQALFVELYNLNALTSHGAKQLIADLNYLLNIANAIYLDEPEFVWAILSVLHCKTGNDKDLKTKLLENIDEANNDKKNDPKLRTGFQRKVATKFAVLRGL